MTIWKTVNSWTFEYFDPDDPVSLTETFRRFHDLWKLKRGDRIAPEWPDFAFEELREWWGLICICDIQREPFDYRYRLWGTKVADAFDMEVTGKVASELRAHEKYNVDDEFEFYRMATQKPTMCLTHGTIFWQNRSHKGFSFLELPLSDDNATVTNMISVMTEQQPLG